MKANRALCVAGLSLLWGFSISSPAACAQGLPQMATPSEPTNLTADDVAMGKQLFAAQCSGCHGFDGSGQLGPNLHGITERKGDAGVFAVIRNGQGAMPSIFSLNDQRVWQVIAYVRTLGDTGPIEAAKGDPVRGKTVYDSNGCATCHAIGTQGGGIGPQLTAIGRSRAPKYFHDFLLDPGKNPPADMSLPERSGDTGYLLIHVVTKDGKDMTGIRVNEDSFTLVLKDVSGHFHTFDKSKLKKIEEMPGKSVMPSYSNLSAADLDDLVAYLSSLKGAQ